MISARIQSALDRLCMCTLSLSRNGENNGCKDLNVGMKAHLQRHERDYSSCIGTL